MSPFPILFFLFVEVPSMGAMLVHKGIMLATGRETKPLNVWLYRLLGVAGVILLVGLSFLIGGNAACLLFVLLIGGGLTALVVQRRNADAAAGNAAGIGPQALPGVLSEMSRRSLGDLRRSLGRPGSPEERDIHLRSADLMAALRFYQVAVDARFLDREIGNQLAANARGMMEHVMAAYRNLPAGAERDAALQILAAYLPPGWPVTGNVYTSFAGSGLRDAR